MQLISLRKIPVILGIVGFALHSFALEKTGTGFAISEDMILTAYHVVESGESISITFGSASYPATITSFNKELDWAVLKMSGKAPGTVILGESSNVKLGESVYSLGYPASDLLGDEIKYSKGEIGALSGLAGSKDHFQISVPIQPGNSGGPLFSGKGHVIGIVVATLDPGVFFNATDGALPQNVNYALKIDLIPNLPRPTDKSKIVPASVTDNQRAVGLVKTKVARSAIVAPHPPKGTKKQTPIASQDPYEKKLADIKAHADTLLSKLTEFSPETFCQTNDISCPIVTEEEADEACQFLDLTKLELEHYLESSQNEVMNSPERNEYCRKHYVVNRFALLESERDIFKDTSVIREWRSARNRLASHFNATMSQNGVSMPTSFWKISFTHESFSSFIDWKETYKIQNTSVGRYKLPMDFFGVSDVFGIRTKGNGLPLALWCHIPATRYKKDKYGTSYGKRIDWTGMPVSPENQANSSQESLLRHVVKLFEKKYHIRFSISGESNLVPTSDGFSEIIPIFLFKPDSFSSGKSYQASSDLYSFNSDSIQILIRSFDEKDIRYSSPPFPFGVFVVVCRPNWRRIADEEAYQLEKAKPIGVDESLLNAL